MLNRASRLAIARVALAIMIFAQGSMAWSACASPERSVELALRTAAEHAGCDQMSSMESAAVSVCLAHCLAEKQILQKDAPDVPAMPSAPVLVVTVPRTDFRSAEVFCLPAAAATGPPRRILLQSFQI